MTELALHVDGMGCRACVREVTALLRDVPGVETVTADHRRSVVLLSGSMSREAVLAALAETRFQIDRIDADSTDTGSGRSDPPSCSPTAATHSTRTATGKRHRPM